MFFPEHLGAYAKAKTAIPAQSSAAATINGAAIDRKDVFSAIIHGQNGVATGAPTARSITFKLQDSADGAAGWADVAGAVSAALTADSTDVELDVSLKGAKRYVRVVAIVGFTGGTTPAVPVAATLVVGGAVNTPLV